MAVVSTAVFLYRCPSCPCPPVALYSRGLHSLLKNFGFCPVCVRVSPDSEGLAHSAKSANQGLLEMLNLQDPRLRIADANSTANAARIERIVEHESAAAAMAAAAAAASKGGIMKPAEPKPQPVFVDPFADDFLAEAAEKEAMERDAAASEAAFAANEAAEAESAHLAGVGEGGTETVSGEGGSGDLWDQ